MVRVRVMAVVKVVVGKNGKGKGEFANPAGIAVDAAKDGLLYVVEYGTPFFPFFGGVEDAVKIVIN